MQLWWNIPLSKSALRINSDGTPRFLIPTVRTLMWFPWTVFAVSFLKTTAQERVQLYLVLRKSRSHLWPVPFVTPSHPYTPGDSFRRWEGIQVVRVSYQGPGLAVCLVQSLSLCYQSCYWLRLWGGWNTPHLLLCWEGQKAILVSVSWVMWTF